MEKLKPCEKAYLLQSAHKRRSVFDIPDNFKGNHLWLGDRPHQPNNIRYAIQIAMDNRAHLKKILLFVEGTLYFYDNDHQITEKEFESWYADSKCYTGFSEWFREYYGLILSPTQAKHMVNLCVQYKIIPKMSRKKFGSIII
jgi:hypothetical protein